ncbi:MAG TPA: protein kinase [Rubrobacteraceae bacterium]
MDLLLGGRFVIERKIGAGGMARVFLGRDEVLERPVAVKILNPGHGSTDIGARFRREGRTAARLAHPNIVQVYDAGEGEFEGREVSYIVMEYVPGGDLKRLIDEKGPLANDELAKLGADVSSGLAHAHANGVIHRDIKPHNILIDAYGRPKLSDFGIARAVDATYATRTGSYLGTALYSAPEQLRGEQVTPKSDVYSLGIAFYQAAVGQAPFTGTPIEVASQHVSREPTVPKVLGANLSDELEALILDCVKKDPDLRPTAQEVHERLQEEVRPARDARAFAIPPISEPPPPAERTPTPPSEEPPQEPPTRETPPREQTPPWEPSLGAGRQEGSWRRWPILLAAAALLLVLLGVTAYATGLVGTEGINTAQAPQEEEEQANSSESAENESTQPAGGSEESTSGQSASEDTVGAGQEETAASGLGQDSESEAAEQALQDHYTAAADGDYDEAWNSLSSRWRQQLGAQQAYTNQFGTLESLTFDEGPTAEVTGDTATITGVTIATHTNRTERNTATWTMVNEDGEWKLDAVTVEDQQLI